MARRQSGVDFEEGGGAQQIGTIVSGKLVELGGGGEDLRHVVFFVVPSMERAGAGLGYKHGSAAHVVDHCRDVENVLIVSGKEEKGFNVIRGSQPVVK